VCGSASDSSEVRRILAKVDNNEHGYYQNGRVTDRERQYKQETDTYIMQSLLM